MDLFKPLEKDGNAQKSRFVQHNGLSHFDARHPLPIVKDVLSAPPDLVAVAAVERLCRQRGVRL